MVVDDLTRLHTCPDEATVSQVLAIVGLGLPVVTSTSWSLALGDPIKVPKESVVRHRPLAMEAKFEFRFEEVFPARSPHLFATLSMLSQRPGTKWKLLPTSARAAGHDFIHLGKEGVSAVRSFLQRQQRIYNLMGSKVWTSTERLL